MRKPQQSSVLAFVRLGIRFREGQQGFGSTRVLARMLMREVNVHTYDASEVATRTNIEIVIAVPPVKAFIRAE
jgi:hypothetical protein